MPTQIFQRNAAHFVRFNPHATILLQGIDCSQYELETTVPGQPNLIKTAGEIVHYHDPLSPQREAQAWFTRLDLQGIQILYVYGVGLGYYCEAAQAWLKQSRKHRLVFLEDDLAVIHRLLETERGSALLAAKQVRLYYFRDLQQEQALFDHLSWDYLMQPIQVSALEYYAKKRSAPLATLQHKLCFEAAMKSTTVGEFLGQGIYFFRNFYANLQALPRAALGQSLHGKMRNIPAIICGAGPSLDKSIAWLKSHRGEALIFAGGSALNALVSNQLLPHFGAGVDPNPAQFERTKATHHLQVPFFYRNRLYYKVLPAMDGPIIYMAGCGGYKVSNWFEEKLEIAPKDDLQGDEGHNVVNFCVEIAHALGCNPLIFVGLDLAFTDNLTYSSGVVAVAPGALQAAPPQVSASLAGPGGKNSDDLPVLKSDIYGKPVYSTWKWIAEAAWISRYSEKFPEIAMINATAGGIGCEGIPNQSLAEIAEKYLTKPELPPLSLEDKVKQALEQARMPARINSDAINALMHELAESLMRCLEHCESVRQEIVFLRTSLQKNQKLSSGLQTGLMAISEAELLQEPGYLYVLEVFDQMYSRKNSAALQFLPSHTKKYALKMLRLEQLKYAFLKETAAKNIHLIHSALHSIHP